MSTRSHVTNPTKVARLPASVVEITVHPDDTFNVKFHALSDAVVDPTHRVWLVAGAGSTIKTFDCGTVAKPTPPADTALTGLDSDKPRVFRLLVWDPANKRISASNERLRIRDGDAPADREPLLPVRLTKLGGEVWKLALGADMAPELLLNSDIPGVKHQLATRPELRGAILPEAVRQCLLHACEYPAVDPSDEGAWQSKWFKFASELGAELLEEPSECEAPELRDWADRVTALFALEHDFAKVVAISWGAQADD